MYKKESKKKTVLAGSSAGICYWSVVFPLAVVKNRIQAAPDVTPPKYAGMAAAAKHVMASVSSIQLTHANMQQIRRLFTHIHTHTHTHMCQKHVRERIRVESGAEP